MVIFLTLAAAWLFLGFIDRCLLLAWYTDRWPDTNHRDITSTAMLFGPFGLAAYFVVQVSLGVAYSLGTTPKNNGWPSINAYTLRYPRKTSRGAYPNVSL